VVTQFQPHIPHPLAHDLPALLSLGGLATPPIRVLFLILVRECIFKRASVQVEGDHISSGERVLGKIRQEEFIDNALTAAANTALLRRCRMGCHDDPEPLAFVPTGTSGQS